MESNTSSSYDFPQLLIKSSSHRIFEAIQNEANLSFSVLSEAKEKQEIDSQKAEVHTRFLNYNFEDVRKFCSALHKVEDDIERKKTNFKLFSQLYQKVIGSGNEDSIDVLADILVKLKQQPRIFQNHKILVLLEKEVSRSLEYRIRLARCWNDILTLRRILAINHIMILTDQMTDIAMELDDEETIQFVKSILNSLDLSFPSRTRPTVSNLSVPELKKLLHRGIIDLKETYQTIERINQQSKKIEETIQQLQEIHPEAKESSIETPGDMKDVEEEIDRKELDIPQRENRTGMYLKPRRFKNNQK